MRSTRAGWRSSGSVVRGATLDDVFLALTGHLPEQAGEAGPGTQHDRSDQKEVIGV